MLEFLCAHHLDVFCREMEVVLQSKNRGDGCRRFKAPLTVRVLTSWLESPCEKRVINLWKKKHNGSWVAFRNSVRWAVRRRRRCLRKDAGRLATEAKELFDAGG